jgi:hypothetical protein
VILFIAGLGVSSQGEFKNAIKKITKTFPQPPKKVFTYSFFFAAPLGRPSPKPEART